MVNKKLKFALVFSFYFVIFVVSIFNVKAMDQVYCPSTDKTYYLNEEQWGIYMINTLDAWNYSTGDSEVLVGVLDSGIDITNPDLSQRVNVELSKSFLDLNDVNEGKTWDNEPILNYDNPFYGYWGHGSHVAGIIAGDGTNNLGISGVAPNVKLVSLRVINNSLEYSEDDVIEAILYAQEKGIKILNCSFGGSDASNELIETIRNYDGLVICSSGNNGTDNDSCSEIHPASLELDNVISVGSSDSEDNKSTFSNYGKKSVDLFAPGENILSTFSYVECERMTDPNSSIADLIRQIHNDLHYSNGYHYESGTSMAAPFVTGVAALLLSKYPQLDPLSIKNIILTNVDKIPSLSQKCVTGGRLNAYNCFAAINHEHKSDIKYYDYKRHIRTCDCGLLEGDFGNHAILREQAEMLLATCVGCNAILNLNRDIAFIIQENNAIKRTKNGSYMLNNGLIVLVAEDVDMYKEDLLKFYTINMNEEEIE